ALLLIAFGSAVVADATVAVLLTVPVVPALTSTTSVKTSLAPESTDGLVQVIVPPAEPTAGSGAHDQPAAEASEAKVTPAGRVSVNEAVAAALGPALATVIV